MTASVHGVPALVPAVLIYVVEPPVIHVHISPVVFKVVIVPPATDETDSHVPEAVVHAAIVANVRTPVAGMEYI
jgi:hypothetical protein